jgi:hypothetical protein
MLYSLVWLLVSGLLIDVLSTIPSYRVDGRAVYLLLSGGRREVCYTIIACHFQIIYAD